jgi:hypothetical protein
MNERGNTVIDLFSDLKRLLVAAVERGDAEMIQRIMDYGEWCSAPGRPESLWLSADDLYWDLFRDVSDWDAVIPFLSSWVVQRYWDDWERHLSGAEVMDLQQRFLERFPHLFLPIHRKITQRRGKRTPRG